MLDFTKPYVEKIHYVDAELAGHVHKLAVKLQSLCGSGFLCLLSAFLQARSQGGAIAPLNSESCTKNFQNDQAFDV